MSATLCPACKGRGSVSTAWRNGGPVNAPPEYSRDREPCHACHTTGVIIIPEAVAPLYSLPASGPTNVVPLSAVARLENAARAIVERFPAGRPIADWPIPASLVNNLEAALDTVERLTRTTPERT